VKKLFYFILFQWFAISIIAQPQSMKNRWTKPPEHIPNNVSIDAPLMGNGDVLMSVGYTANQLRYYLCKNDFWRLKSQADSSGLRFVGFIDVNFNVFHNESFSAEQNIQNGLTVCTVQSYQKKIYSRSWVSATDNLIFIELEAIEKPIDISISLSSPFNHEAKLREGNSENTYWLTRAFDENVEIPVEVAVAMKLNQNNDRQFTLLPNHKVLISVAVESKFRYDDPLRTVLTKCRSIDDNATEKLFQKHNEWWQTYWDKSSIQIGDSVLMKAYYQGLYTMAACSRDPKFPPGLFGWTTNDDPGWGGDYHMNYNFVAPFYALYSTNRLEQALPEDAPLLDFIPRGEWYAQNVTNTRGILYPVGIGPLGIEVTRNTGGGYLANGCVELGGLFHQQRSNAAYGLVNMAQCWRCTYDKDYGKKIYPYVMGVVNFWEDYLKFENGRYVIYDDAIHEGSGKNKNPILSLGLIKNAMDLAIDLSHELSIDQDRQKKWKDIIRHLSDFPVQMRNGEKVFRYSKEGMDWNEGNGLGIQHIYPSNAITFDSDPALLNIALNTIDQMKRWHDGNTSNSFFVAAIRIGYDSSVILTELHKYALNTYPNGFQFGNPHGIENACTVANALNEMFCMSVGNVIRLFQNFPKNKEASFKNIRTWGAFLVSAQQKSGFISDVKIVSEKGRDCTMINPWQNKVVELTRNGKKAETINGYRISFKTAINETIELKSL